MTVPPVRKRRWPKVLGLLFLLLVVVVWFAPVFVAKSPLRNRILASALADMNGTVEMDSLSLGWLSPVEATGITVRDAKGTAVATVESVTTTKTLLALASNRSDIGPVTVAKPNVTVVCTAERTNWETILAKYLDSNPSAKPKPVIKLVVVDGTVTIRDDRSESVLSNVVADATIGETILFDVKGGIANPAGSFAAKGLLAAGGTLAAEWTQLPMPLVAMLARRFETGLVATGRTTGKASVTWENGDIQATGMLAGESWAIGSRLLGSDTLRSQLVAVPFAVRVRDSVVTVTQCEPTFDFGEANLVGEFDLRESPERWLNRPGLKLDGTIDVAKLASMLPTTLNLLPGMTLQEGRVTVAAASVPKAAGTTWTGTLKSTRLRGVRDGRTIDWDSPINAGFAGRMADGVPTFDTLTVQSDFVAINATGSPEKFEAAARIDLARLNQRLGEFIDLSAWQLAGTGIVRAWNRGESAELSADLDNVTIVHGSTLAWREPKLTFAATAAVIRNADGSFGLRRGRGTLTAGGDSLTVNLVEPIPDLRAAKSGAADLTLAGDLARWKVRVGPMAGIPADWIAGGTVQAVAFASLTESGLSLSRVDAAGTNVSFRGAGLSVAEPALRIKANVAAYDFAKGHLAVERFHFGSETVAADADRLDLQPGTNPPRADGTLTVAAARLGRLQRMLGMTESIDGMAKGTVKLSSSNGPIGFDVDLSAETVRFGDLRNPSWQEPWVKVAGRGTIDLPRDAVSIDALRIERDGLSVIAKGRLSELSTEQQLDVTGDVTFDLAKLEPQIKGYLGKGGRVAGKDTKPFALAGSLADPTNLTVAVGPDRRYLPQIGGNAAASWQSIRAYGFDVGPAELKATAKNGTVNFDAVRATFGGGQVVAKPTLLLNPGRFDLRIDPARIVEKARITPAVCADALGFALPAIANSTEAEGLMSVDLESGVVPLADYTAMTAKGKLQLHTVTLTPGPVVNALLQATNVTEAKFQLANEQTVPVWIEKGRVHHTNLSLAGKNFSLKTSGSVGFDGSMQLNVEFPIPPRLVEQAFKNNPRIRDALTKRTMTIALGGTVNSPKIDARAIQANLQKLFAEAGRDALKEAAGGLLQKELEKNLDKLLPKKP